ncbi:MAG: hypothetical protein V3W31_07485 [Thermodesulfobacteriota bacterium]
MKRIYWHITGRRGWLVSLFFAVLFVPSTGWTKTSSVAVLPWELNAPPRMEYARRAVVDMLSSRVGSSLSVEIVRTDLVKEAVENYAGGGLTDDTVEKIGRALGADYVLYGSLTAIEDSISLDVKFMAVADGAVRSFFSRDRGMGSIVGMTDAAASKVLASLGEFTDTANGGTSSGPAYIGKFRESAPESVAAKEPSGDDEEFIIVSGKEEAKKFLWRSRHIQGAFFAMESLDLDNDGGKELVLLGTQDLLIARVGEDGLETIKEIKGHGDVRNIAVAAFDSDGDGVIELYVSRTRAGLADSFVVERRDGDYTVTASAIPWLMRVIGAQGGETTLIGARFEAQKGGFSRAVDVLKREGDEVVSSGDAFDMPELPNIYGFEIFDVTGDGQAELVAIGKGNYIRIYRRDDGPWKEFWKSREPYGGTLNALTFGDEDAELAERPFAEIEGKFLHTDLDSDGREELIIKRNTPGGIFGRRSIRVMEFTGGEVRSLSWDGAFLEENWRTREVDGYVSDFVIDDIDGDGSREIVMLVVDGIKAFKLDAKSYILSYTLP